MKEKMYDIILAFIYAFCVYLIIVSVIQRFSNPELTNTELMLLLPKNLMLEFE